MMEPGNEKSVTDNKPIPPKHTNTESHSRSETFRAHKYKSNNNNNV
jgi:hypothetical protein